MPRMKIGGGGLEEMETGLAIDCISSTAVSSGVLVDFSNSNLFRIKNNFLLTFWSIFSGDGSESDELEWWRLFSLVTSFWGVS